MNKIIRFIFRNTSCRIGIHHGRCANGIYTCDYCATGKLKSEAAK